MVTRPSSSPIRHSRQSHGHGHGDGHGRVWNRCAVLLGHGGSLRGALHAVTAALLVGAFAATAAGLMPPSAAGASNWAPVHSGDFPDPDIVQWSGGVIQGVTYPAGYYAYATQSTPPKGGQQVNIQVSYSADGLDWSNNAAQDALPDSGLGTWAEPGDTWAPSVAVYQGPVAHGVTPPPVFVMYYTATERATGDQCIGMAIASSPFGPYADSARHPVVCDNDFDSGSTVDDGPYGGSIDPDVFTDPATQNSYLLWKSDGNHIGESTVIWSAPLSADLQTITLSGQANQLLIDDESWQSGIVEAPDMYDNQVTQSGSTTNNYYLFYAGSDEGANTYGIGWATCQGPVGPCQDGPTSNNPMLTTQPGMSGPGGPDIFTLPATQSNPSGQLALAFAAWEGTTIGYLQCGIRPMYVANLAFSGGIPYVEPAEVTAAAVGPTCPEPPIPAPGYWQVASDGGVFTFGAAHFYGSTGSIKLNQPVVGMAPTPDHQGYWLVASDGGVFAFGDAGFYGSTGSIRLNKPIIDMIPTLDGRGYWLVASDGGVFAFGDAPFYGSAGGENLAYPVTAAAGSYLDGGYWIVDSNGQVFSYGDAKYEGQPPFAPGDYRITGMAPTHSSNGYWLASANGNVATFGDAAPYGNVYGLDLNSPVVGMATSPDGAGYWLQGGDGGIFTFGDAPFMGSMGGQHLNAPMVGIAST
jgi:hypothetical protein